MFISWWNKFLPDMQFDFDGHLIRTQRSFTERRSQTARRGFFDEVLQAQLREDKRTRNAAQL